MPTKQIAELVGKSRNSVSLKAHKLGIAFNYVNKVEANADSLRWFKRNFPHMANEICATYLGLSLRTVVRLARKYNLEKTEQFMREAQAHAAQRAHQSHLRNGTYPPKGFIIPNSEQCKFKKKHENRIN
jgi:hypothetical protein